LTRCRISRISNGCHGVADVVRACLHRYRVDLHLPVHTIAGAPGSL
jgi:hypothetical protein